MMKRIVIQQGTASQVRSRDIPMECLTDICNEDSHSPRQEPPIASEGSTTVPHILAALLSSLGSAILYRYLRGLQELCSEKSGGKEIV